MVVQVGAPENKVPVLLSPKEAKQIELQRETPYAKYEIHVENGQPVKMINIRESIQL